MLRPTAGDKDYLTSMKTGTQNPASEFVSTKLRIKFSGVGATAGTCGLNTASTTPVEACHHWIEYSASRKGIKGNDERTAHPICNMPMP